MRKCSYGTRLGTSLAATVLAIGLAATPSLATTAKTWTVRPGGSFSGRSGRVTVTDTANGVKFFCSSSSISGKLKSGSGLAGAKIASITAWTFGQCEIGGQEFYTLENNPAAFPYPLNAESYAATSGKTTASVTGIQAAMFGSGCTLTVDGITPTTLGQVKGVYTNSTHHLVTSGGTLHFWNVSSGCLGLYNTGDRITISATFAVTPAQAIKSP